MNPLKLKSLIIFFSIVSYAGFAQAAEQAKAKRGGWCICNAFRGPESQFNCEHIGVVTISQIYDKGWKIIHKQDTRNTAAVVELIIEEQ